MKQTENYGFNVPEEHEFYDVAARKERIRIWKNFLITQAFL